MDQVIQQAFYNILPFISSAREIIYLTRVSKGVRASFGLAADEEKSHTPIAKKYLQMFYEQAIKRYLLDYAKLPKHQYYALRDANVMLTGSSTLQIFENKYFAEPDIDIYVNNKDEAKTLIDKFINQFRYEKKKFGKVPSDNWEHVYTSGFAKNPIGFEATLLPERDYDRRYNSKIDVLNISVSSVENFDLDICANWITLDGKHYKWSNIDSIITRRSKFMPNHKENVIERLRTYLKYKDYNDKQNNDVINETNKNAFIKKIRSTEVRIRKYMLRGYMIVDDYLSLATQAERDALFNIKHVYDDKLH